MATDAGAGRKDERPDQQELQGYLDWGARNCQTEQNAAQPQVVRLGKCVQSAHVGKAQQADGPREIKTADNQ